MVYAYPLAMPDTTFRVISDLEGRFSLPAHVLVNHALVLHQCQHFRVTAHA